MAAMGSSAMGSSLRHTRSTRRDESSTWKGHMEGAQGDWRARRDAIIASFRAVMAHQFTCGHVLGWFSAEQLLQVMDHSAGDAGVQPASCAPSST